MTEASLPALIFIAVVIAQRLAELALARRNTARLLARGGREVGAAHYPLIVTLHAAWIVALIVWGWRSPLSLPWLGLYAALQILRAWILMSLGPRWTTRIIVIDEPLVRRGPYGFFPHPNYALVVAEIIVVPMVLGLPVIALVFTVLNAMVLAIRISAENRALGA
ncbi:MAG TPA: isoprenylcysteine carboxylmethyltransferase family protein [Devosiaceae bacterium]|jgi:methyltransferase